MQGFPARSNARVFACGIVPRRGPRPTSPSEPTSTPAAPESPDPMCLPAVTDEVAIAQRLAHVLHGIVPPRRAYTGREHAPCDERDAS